MVDFTSALGKRAAAQLTTAQIVWFTTVGADSAPQPSPVWFLWEADTVLIFSRPDAPKVRNVARNPYVALNFREDSLVISGQAEIAGPQTAVIVAAYIEKYREGITKLAMTPDTFTATYATAIRVHLTGIRGN